MYSEPYVTSTLPLSIPERPEFCGLCQVFHPPMAHIVSKAQGPVRNLRKFTNSQVDNPFAVTKYLPIPIHRYHHHPYPHPHPHPPHHPPHEHWRRPINPWFDPFSDPEYVETWETWGPPAACIANGLWIFVIFMVVLFLIGFGGPRYY